MDYVTDVTDIIAYVTNVMDIIACDTNVTDIIVLQIVPRICITDQYMKKLKQTKNRSHSHKQIKKKPFP